MRFWDASAVIPLCVAEPATDQVRSLLRDDAAMAVWWGTPIECWSAFARLRRTGTLTTDGEDASRHGLHTLQRAWFEIVPGEDVRERAGRLMRLHPINAADALQLAAALVWAGNPPAGEIVVLDQRLRQAARLEGLVPRP